MSWLTPPPRSNKPVHPILTLPRPRRAWIAFVMVLIPAVIGAGIGGLLMGLVRWAWPITPRWVVGVALSWGFVVGALIGYRSLMTVLYYGATVGNQDLEKT